MTTYESSGSLTTIEKSFSSPQTPNLSGLVYSLNGESITVDVVGSPGDVGEEIVSQTLDGASSYDLTWSSSHSNFEIVFDVSTSDTSVSPEFDDISLQSPDDAGSVISTSNGVFTTTSSGVIETQ